MIFVGVIAQSLARASGLYRSMNPAWHDCVAVPSPDIGQDETGRLWDVLNVFRFAARGVSNSDVRFSVLVVRGENSQQEVKLKALCHPGDTAEPVITIMLPDED